MSEPSPLDEAAAIEEASAKPAAADRPRSETIGTGSAFAIGCVLLLVVAMAVAVILLPRLR